MSYYIGTLLPNYKLISFTPGDATHWYKVTGFPGLDPGMAYGSATIRSVAAGSLADGSPFQMLFNRSSVPADATVGKLVSGSGQTETMPGGLANCYVKLTAATDLIEIEVFY